MILKGGGANGSGKTSVARAFMKLWKFAPVTNARGKPLEYVAHVTNSKQALAKLFNKVVVLGDYRSVCGGMDGVQDKDLRLSLVERYCSAKEKRTLVLYEGVLTGVTYGAMGELSDRSPVKWVYWFPDTPYEECVRRVVARREAKGNVTPFDGKKSLFPKIRACQSVARRAVAAGHEVIWLDHTKSAESQVKVLVRFVERVSER